MPPSSSTLTSSRGLSRRLVMVMAVATGLSAANLYYAQPLLAVIRRDLHVSAGTAGLVVTATQVGYAAGLVLLLPLGDKMQRRRLVVVMSTLSALALAWTALAGSAGSLLPAALAVGALSVVAQILVPFAASLAPPEERGRVVGTVMSGLLMGILLARTAAGLIAAGGAWRTVYWAAAAAMLVQAGVLRRVLPPSGAATGLGYAALLGSLGSLVRAEPVLRLRAAYGGFAFGSFSVLWTSLAFLLAGPPYRFSTPVIGLFGLAGAGGALTATGAGRLADRGGKARTTFVAALLITGSWLPTWLGHRSLAALLVGIVVLDVGVQGLHVTNQSEIYRIRPEATSRMNSVYMTSFFTGGAAGSALSAYLYGIAGWTGVSLAGAGFGVAALLLSAAARATTSTGPPGRSGSRSGGWVLSWSGRTGGGG
jgi:predicted MFS family arabinose efflux permease